MTPHLPGLARTRPGVCPGTPHAHRPTHPVLFFAPHLFGSQLPLPATIHDFPLKISSLLPRHLSEATSSAPAHDGGAIAVVLVLVTHGDRPRSYECRENVSRIGCTRHGKGPHETRANIRRSGRWPQLQLTLTLLALIIHDYVPKLLSS